LTRKRNDSHSTEFGLWLREQPEICSSAGYVATNLDYIWGNYKTGEWMLIEEKRHNRKPTWSQKKQFEILHNAAKYDENYIGFYVVVFENTSPIDGDIYINNLLVSSDELIDFLGFNLKIAGYFENVLQEVF
jgi:hypothetical protein